MQYRLRVGSPCLTLDDFKDSLFVRGILLYELNNQEWVVCADLLEILSIPLLQPIPLSCPVMINVKMTINPYGIAGAPLARLRSTSTERALNDRVNDHFVGVFKGKDFEDVKDRYFLRHCYLYDKNTYNDFYTRAYDSIAHHRGKLKTYGVGFPSEYYISLEGSTLKKVTVIGGEVKDFVLKYG